MMGDIVHATLDATSIDYNGYGASVALCVDSERDVEQLARLDVRLNVLRLGSHQYRKPTIFDQDNTVASEPYVAPGHDARQVRRWSLVARTVVTTSDKTIRCRNH